MHKRLWDSTPVWVVRETVNLYFEKNVARAAAALAYFLLLTFFPLLICVNAFVGMLQLDRQVVFQTLAEFVPVNAASLVGEYVGYISENQSAALLTAGIVAVLVSASAALRTLLDAMDAIHDRPRQGGFGRLVFSVVLSLLLLITVYLSMVVVLTGDWFLTLLEQLIPPALLRLIDFPGVSGLWNWMKFLLLFCFVMLLVLALYRIGAPRRMQPGPRAPVITGGVLASIALVLASAVFSWFIGMSSRYSLLYGSLASVIILMVWLYLCGTILLLGSVFNRVWYRHRLRRRIRRLDEMEKPDGPCTNRSPGEEADAPAPGVFAHMGRFSPG